MSTETGASTAAVICCTRVSTSSKVMPSWSALPTESASGWLPTVSAANPASTANLADQASHTVGRTTGFPGWCKASSGVGALLENLVGHGPNLRFTT